MTEFFHDFPILQRMNYRYILHNIYEYIVCPFACLQTKKNLCLKLLHLDLLCKIMIIVRKTWFRVLCLKTKKNMYLKLLDLDSLCENMVTVGKTWF